MVHAPLTHNWPAAHTVRHAPQLFGSTLVSLQSPLPQSVRTPQPLPPVLG
jgi:hypothetical protein